MKVCCCFIMLFFFCHLQGQDLTGTWEGTGTLGTSYVKMVIVKTGNTYTGYTYDRGMGYCKANFLGTFDPLSIKLKGKGNGFIETSFGHSQGVYNLKYSSAGDEHFLKGPVWPKSPATKILSMGPVIVNLRRTSTLVDTTDFIRRHLVRTETPIEVKDDSIAAVLNDHESIEKEILVAKQERLGDTLQTIITPDKKIKIKLFDNGISDGDSVSIVYNEKLVAGRVVVTSKAFEFDLELENGTHYHSITLVAHNLGSIPPNTATIVIQTGDKTYRLSASSDFRKNAVIIIQNPD